MANYVVSGAGTSAYNGTYVPIGTVNGGVEYSNDGGSHILYFDNTAGSADTWWLDTAVRSGSGHASSAYSNPGPVGTVATGTWTGIQSGGTAPEPTVTLVAPPLAPTSIVYTPGNNQVAISWSPASGALSVNVKRSLTSGGTYTNLSAGTGVTGSSFTDTTAVNGTIYYYELSSVNGAGEGSVSSASAGQTPFNPSSILAPASLTVAIVGSALRSTWTAPSSGGPYTGYNIYRSTTGAGGFYSKLNTSPIAWGTFTFDDFLVGGTGTSYSYYVVVTNMGMEGAASTIATATFTTTARTGTSKMFLSKSLRGFNFGLESLAAQGTAVTCDKRIANGAFSNKRQNHVKASMAEGHKSAIGTQRGKRWSEWKISGAFGYGIAPYLASMMVLGGVPATTVGTTGKKYSFPMNSFNGDVPQTMTFEYGNSTGSNSRLSYGVMSDLTLKVNTDACDYDCSGFANYPTKNITMNPSPTTLNPILANMTDFRFNYATTFAGLSAGKLTTAEDLELSIKNKYKAVFFVDDATTSLGGYLEKQPEISAKLIVAEGTESDYFLGGLENNALVYLQMQATGPLIEVGTPNVYWSFKNTMALYLTNEDETDSNDLFSGSYDFVSGEDVTNNSLNLECVTTYATL